MFFENDRTFCENANCEHTECYRHQANVVGKPRFISIADFEGTKECTKESEMSRDKQIEEMAKDFCAVGIPCEDCHLYKNRCHAKKYATRAYNNGYRKASEVAREIFEEIEASAKVKYWRGGALVVFEVNGEDFAELKKKYTETTEGGENE